MLVAEGGCNQVASGVHRGDSVQAGANNFHWMIGDNQPDGSPLQDLTGFKLKFHRCSTADFKPREKAAADPTNRVLQLCLEGSVTTSFPQDENPENDVHVTMSAGEYCLWEPGTTHYWKIEEDESLIASISWPAG